MVEINVKYLFGVGRIIVLGVQADLIMRMMNNSLDIGGDLLGLTRYSFRSTDRFDVSI